jgi:hypothetical protein
MCFCRDQHKGEDERVLDFWSGYVAALMFLRILNWVLNVFYPKKNICCFVGALKVFGTKGMMGNTNVWTG